MPAQGPSLNFDPRYVDFTISTWQGQNCTSLPVEDLRRATAEYANHVFGKLNMIGLADEHVKATLIASALALLKSLKLLKETKVGPKNGKVAMLAETALGSDILHDEPTAGAIRPRLVGFLGQQSPPLHRLLQLLSEHGPLSRPTVNPLPGTPRKGAAFNRAVLDGLVAYESSVSPRQDRGSTSTARQSATQKLKVAAADATRQHPISAISSLEKLLPLAAALGLIWRDIEQINEAIGVEYVGSAATLQDGSYLPRVRTWQDSEAHFTQALWQVYTQRVTSSGYTTISAVRGGIGRQLQIAAPVVDTFLCVARELGDRGGYPLTLQFESDIDLLYAPDRQPLIWQDTAFDFVAVTRSQDSSQTVSVSRVGQGVGFPPA